MFGHQDISYTIQARYVNKSDNVCLFQFIIPSNSMITEVIITSTSNVSKKGQLALLINGNREEFKDIDSHQANAICMEIDRGGVMVAEVTGFNARELVVYYYK